VDPSRDDTVLVDLDDQIPRRRIGLVRHRDRYQTPAAKAFIELAREMAVSFAEQMGEWWVARNHAGRSASTGS